MRTRLAPLRGALAVLLIGSGILFLVGSTIERSHRHHEARSAAKPATTEGGGETGQGGGETGSESSANRSEPAGRGEAGAKILGVNTESLALSIVAVVLSMVLAAVVWLGRWRGIVLAAVLAFGLVFTAGDAREVVHQLDESNNGLAAVAAILIALHLLVAALAVALLRVRPPSVIPEGNPV